MKLGIRGKLFATAAGAVTVLVLVSGLYLESHLRHSQQKQIEAELFHGARAVREMALVSPDTSLDGVADRMGEALSARVTIIARGGHVLGDSEVAADELVGLDNHASRPEIVDARHMGRGSASRYSETLDEAMLYLAIPYEGHAGSQGFVRVALPLTQVDRAARRLRAALAIGGALGLALALLGGAVSSHLLTRDFRAAVARVHSLAVSHVGSRAPDRESGEMESLAQSIDRMAGELQRHMATLADERDRFAAVIEGMDAAVLAVDREGRISLINARAVRLLRVQEGADGNLFDESVEAPELRVLLGRALDGETTFEELSLPGNPPRLATVRATPQRMSGGAVLVMHDITRQRRLEKVRQDFVANVSHELRTPVTVIRANADTLLAGAIEEPERAKEFLSAVLRNAVRMSQIVSDLLDLTRIEAGKLDLEIRPVSVRSSAARALDSVAQVANVRSLDVRIDVDDDLFVAADEQALDQILINLVDNAIKYTPAGGHVVIDAAPTPAGVRIAVRDDGPGIDPKLRERIFERFYRVDKGRSREMGGTGLGLAIVKHLVAALEGEIGVEPAAGGGSEFWVLLEPPGS